MAKAQLIGVPDDPTPYLRDFGLRERPFGMVPDERFTFYTAATKDAIIHGDHIIAQRRGLVTVEGEIGLGKTTLAQRFFKRNLLEENGVAMLRRVPGGVRQTESRMYAAIAEELEIPVRRTADHTLDAIAQKATQLYARGRTLVVIVDDAHRSRSPAIAAYLSLLNLLTDKVALVQLLLLGELPEMSGVLRASKALHSRLGMHTRLNPLTRIDVEAMVRHRLTVAGRTADLFTADALDALADRTRGIPRTICHTASLACTLAWDMDAPMVDRAHVIAAADRLMHADG